MHRLKRQGSRDSIIHAKRVADWTKAIITIVSALPAVAAAAASLLQWHALQAQTRQEASAASEELSELKSANRPIVAIKSFEAAGPLTFGADGVSIQFKVVLDNVGRGTAEFVHIEGDLFPSDGSDLSFSDADCEDRRRQKIDEDLGGKAIWPGSSLVTWPNVLMDKDNYAKWLARWKNGSDDEPIWVIGCVDYVFNGQHHQTGFVREIDRTGPDEWDRIDPRKGTVRRNAIILLQHPAIAEVSD